MNNFKALFTAAVLGTSLIAAAPAAMAATPTQAVVVDYQKVAEASKAYQDANKQLEEKFGAQKKELQDADKKLGEDNKKLQDLKAALDKDTAAKKISGATLTKRTKEFDTARKAFEANVQAFQAKYAKFQQEYTRAQQEALAGLDRAIMEKIAQFAKDKKYPLVVDSRFVVYGDKSSDITEEVIEAFKAEK